MEETTIQVEESHSTPEHTLSPIIYASWILGVGVAKPKNCSKLSTILLRVCHFAICTVIVAFSALDFLSNFGKEFTSILFEIAYWVNETMCRIASYYYVTHPIRHHDEWPKLMEKLESLDRNVRKETAINDNPVKICQILAILIVCLFGPVSLIAHVTYYYFTEPEQIFATDLFFYYTISQTLMNTFVFNVIVYMIRQRFRAINEIIERLDIGAGTQWIAFKIRNIRKLYSGQRSLIELINETYGINLLISSTNSFIMVVAKLFRIYMSAVEHKSGFIFLNNLIWMIYGGQFIITCLVCTLTCREINKIDLKMNEFALNARCSTKFNKLGSFRNSRNEEPERLEISDNLCNDTNSLNSFGMGNLLLINYERDLVRNEINDFFMQLQLYRVAFTACDFFELNNSLLTRFIGVITTYLIILLQFYRPDDF